MAPRPARRRTLDGDIVSGPFLIDGHVHYYPNFHRDVFFGSALANFRRAADALGATSDYAGCLLFAESAGMNYFGRFRDAAGRAAGDAWTFHTTGEAESLVAQRDADARLLLVAGRQIITAEGLEVLALCCDAEVRDGQPLASVIEAASRLDAIVVVPWAFGKWWSGRGVLIDRLVRSIDPTSLFLGDNGGRAKLIPRPGPFRVAESRGIGILPGSDPFPLRRDQERAGGYGFVIDGTIERSRPAAALKRLLRNRAGRTMPYGHRIGVLGFCRNQLLIRVDPERTRARRAAAGR